MIIYPGERYLDIVKTITVKKNWMQQKELDDFDSKEDYYSHKEKWIKHVRETFNFNFTFVSDEHNIHKLLDMQKKIADIKKEFKKEKLGTKSGQ